MRLVVSTHSAELELDDVPSDCTGWDVKQRLHAKYADAVPPAAEQALVRPVSRHLAGGTKPMPMHGHLCCCEVCGAPTIRAWACASYMMTTLYTV